MINRRKSIAAIVGGIFAPAITKGGDAHKISTNYSIVDQATEAKINPANSAEHLLKRQHYINRLTKTANGELEDWQLDDLNSNYDHQARIHNIANLKSVSLPMKNIIATEIEKERRKANWMKSAKEELARLLSLKFP